MASFPIYESPMSLKSRIMTAIWARFAASATSVKSLRKVSVEGVLPCVGAGGEILLSGDSLVVAVKELNEVCRLVDVGEEIGTFMLTDVWFSNEEASVRPSGRNCRFLKSRELSWRYSSPERVSLLSR